METLRFAAGALVSHRLRSVLTAGGIAIGIAAVVLLTSIGEGIHRFVLAEFTQFGTNLVAVTPGKTETFGFSGSVISNVRPLSLDDARALQGVTDVIAALPVVQGNAQVESRNRRRRTMVLGVGPEVPTVWSIRVAAGRFLPTDDQSAPRAFAVLGHKLRKELFRDENIMGQRIRVGSDRYRVIGVMEPKGQLLGFDMDDVIYIPAAKALGLFNRESVMEIDLLYATDASVDKVVRRVRQLLIRRHGHEDFTVITQQQMLDVLGSVLNVLTVAVAALGGISLFVGGVGILTIMTIAVSERTAEIGLLRAVGASRSRIMTGFLAEAALLALMGGAVGLALGMGGGAVLAALVPGLPLHTSWGYVILAEALALFIGLSAGVLPARRAARLDPVEALRTE